MGNLTRPLTRPLTSPLTRALTGYAQGGVAVLVGKFVDYISGLDANAGSSLATAKKTFAGVMAVAVPGGNVYLARGSTWREQITSSDANGFAFGVAGTGAMPVIDGADVATGWTRTDIPNFPNRWTVTWTRVGPITGSDDLGLWVDGVRPRIAASFADLASLGGWYATDYRAITIDVHIDSATDPNSNGKLYEITKRNSGFNWHAQTSVSTATINITGPIEVRRCVGHYNAIAAGAGVVKQALVRDGSIHHLVTMGSSTEDCIATEMRPGAQGIPFTAYRADGTGFMHKFKRCLALFDGGSSRQDAATGFYAHASTGTTLIQQVDLEECMARGIDGVACAALVQNVSNSYFEDPNQYAIDINGYTATLNRCMILDTAATPHVGGNMHFRNSNLQAAITITDCAGFNYVGPAFSDGVPTTGSVAITNCSLVTHGGNAYNGGKAAMNYCVMDAEGRAASSVATGYSGDHNVFFSFSGNTDDPFIHYNGSLYSYKSLAGFQTASGTNANSVYTKYADQTSGNTYAFWLGTKNGTGGPEVGDFRINPTCRVFDSAGTARTGTFTDGVSVTLAGPQTHWDYNTRASVAGPPTARPTLPTTIAQMRTLVNAPAAWVY